jgi:acylphosphatase
MYIVISVSGSNAGSSSVRDSIQEQTCGTQICIGRPAEPFPAVPSPSAQQICTCAPILREARVVTQYLAGVVCCMRPVRMGAVKRLSFEVYGRVQGVSFRAYTEREARKIGAVGWCRNTSKGTVQGEVQGSEVCRRFACLPCRSERFAYLFCSVRIQLTRAAPLPCTALCARRLRTKCSKACSLEDPPGVLLACSVPFALTVLTFNRCGTCLQDQVQHMQQWLSKTGSPASKIEKVDFGTVEDIEKASYSSFETLSTA